MPKSPHPPVTSLWLLACADDEALLTSIVDTLAARHGTPRFRPHLTLAPDASCGVEAWQAILPSLAQTFAPVESAVADIVLSDLFFRSFYALFPADPHLAPLRSAAHAGAGLPETPFTPHVSLLYGPVPDESKQASAAEVRSRLAGRIIRFDRLALTNSGDHVPIADWQALLTVPLTGQRQN